MQLKCLSQCRSSPSLWDGVLKPAVSVALGLPLWVDVTLKNTVNRKCMGPVFCPPFHMITP